MFVILYNQCINVFIISLAHIRMLYVSLHLSWLRVLVSSFTFDVFIECFGLGIMRRTEINLNFQFPTMPTSLHLSHKVFTNLLTVLTLHYRHIIIIQGRHDQ